MTTYVEDEELIKRLKVADDAMIKKVFEQYRPAFINFIRNSFHCENAKADAIYPECFAILYFNIQHKKLKPPLQSSLQTYLFSVGKHVFHKRNYDKHQKATIALAPEIDILTEEMVSRTIEEKEQAGKLQALLKSVGNPCQRLLHLFYFRNYSFESIARELGENEARLRKRKYDCLKKLHVLIEKNKISF